ncbi:hypothetical protein [Staphylococcus piscifermentans]|nr:hypothetical protein [Staphylococcus piscifermentans]
MNKKARKINGIRGILAIFFFEIDIKMIAKKPAKINVQQNI